MNETYGDGTSDMESPLAETRQANNHIPNMGVNKIYALHLYYNHKQALQVLQF